jgi:hypothetical protein
MFYISDICVFWHDFSDYFSKRIKIIANEKDNYFTPSNASARNFFARKILDIRRMYPARHPAQLARRRAGSAK